MGKREKTISILFILPIITGILLGLSALPSNLYFINFIAFIPLLVASDRTLTCKRPILIFAIQLLITLIVFYFWVYLWVLKTANLGFLIGFIIVLPFVLLIHPFILLKKRNNKFAPVYFISSWLTVELLQSYFQLGSPFYNLGHNLGSNPQLIQWYEYTGAAGGTLWILCVNFAIYYLGKTLIKDRKYFIRRSIFTLCMVFIPITISIIIYHNYKEKGSSSEVLIIHPNTDCYNIKYKTDIYDLMNLYLDIMLPQLTDKTSYVILPETAIPNGGWVHQLNTNLIFDRFHLKTQQYPKLKLITGAVTYEAIKNPEKIRHFDKMPNIKYSKKFGVWYYAYNTALQVENGQSVKLRTKQELVPFQEYAPFPIFLPHINPVGIDFKFSTRTENENIFVSSENEKVAALICYESVYGKLYSKYAREGAEAFFELLNEGWYNDTKVSRQFICISTVRAIETRRDIAHSSNMGISCAINQKGDIAQSYEEKRAGFIKTNIHFNKHITLYSRLDDYIGFISSIIMIFLLISDGIKNKRTD